MNVTTGLPQFAQFRFNPFLRIAPDPPTRSPCHPWRWTFSKGLFEIRSGGRGADSLLGHKRSTSHVMHVVAGLVFWSVPHPQATHPYCSSVGKVLMVFHGH